LNQCSFLTSLFFITFYLMIQYNKFLLSFSYWVDLEEGLCTALLISMLCWVSQRSAVGIAARLEAGWSGFQILVGARDFFPSLKHPDWLWGLTSLLLSRYEVLSWEWISWGVINNSPVPSAKVKNECNCISSPHIFCHGVYRKTFGTLWNSCCKFVQLIHLIWNLVQISYW
jgi:hypothetical protein